jgi:Xaa-Pro dipeptidase
MLLNHPRAIDVMARENFDALIAHQPINVYYLSDYWGMFNTPVGYDGAYFALLPKATDRPAGLIAPALEIRRTETKGTWIDNIYGFSSPTDELYADGTAKGIDYTGWQARPGAELTELEQRWVNVVARYGSEMSANGFWALARAIKAAGLENARIATDEPRLATWLASCGLDSITVEYRAELFNEIRLVKTEDELAIMKTAARINETSLLTAARAMREGSSWKELEDVYMATMAQQGGRGVYMMCGVGELPDGKVRRNEPVMFDALCKYEHYHGDFGRCAVVGEPSAEHVSRHHAICNGWDVAQDHLKPGVRYSELSSAVGDAVRASGFKGFRNPVVHSLGLEHTDDPKYPGVQPQDKPDQTLQAGMVVNVDMPHSEFGWGSVHMEDTVVITNSGCERLASSPLDLIRND